MSVIASELKWVRSTTITDTDSNGGRKSANVIVTGVKNNIFPDVSELERQGGFVRYRKVTAINTNAANDQLVNPVQHFKTYTPGEDFIEFFPGTPTDTQASFTEPALLFGCAAITSDITSGATVFAVTLEDTTQVIFDESGVNHIYIGNGTQQEYHKNVTAVKSGVQVTLTLDGGDQLSNNYLASNSVCSSVYSQAFMRPEIESVVLTSAGGSYDHAGTPVTGDNRGSIEGTFRLTFTSDTVYDLSEDTLGAIGSSNISTDYSPPNSTNGGYFLKILSAGWGGTLVAGDELVIVTHAAAQSIWCKQTVPAGSNSYSGNMFTLRHGGESA